MFEEETQELYDDLKWWGDFRSREEEDNAIDLLLAEEGIAA